MIYHFYFLFTGFLDISIILVGSLSGFLSTMCLSFVTKSWHMYLEVCLGVFIGVIVPTTRSLISSSAPVDDTGIKIYYHVNYSLIIENNIHCQNLVLNLVLFFLGKVFSLVSFVDTLLPLGSAPLYSLLYSSYISVYPSPVYLMTSGIFMSMIFVSIFIYLKYFKEKSLN